MREAMREADAKFLSDCDPASKKRSSSLDSDSDSDSSEDGGSTEDLYSLKDLHMKTKEESKGNTNKKMRCDDCDQELSLRKYSRKFQSLKHKKNERVSIEYKIIERAKRRE